MSRRSMTLSGDSSWGGRKRNSDEMDLDITPMIDVTFLLLIFFMVASTMQATPDASVPAVKHGGSLDREYSFTFYITGGESRTAPPIVRDEKNVEHTLDEMAAKIQAALDAGKNKVVIYCDGSVPHGYVLDVERAVMPKEKADREKIELKYGVRQKRY